MDTVGVRELKDRLSEYIRRAKAGETVLITSHGEGVAELRAPDPDRESRAPEALRSLARRGVVRRLVRNEPGAYRAHQPILKKATARELLDWDRGDR